MTNIFNRVREAVENAIDNGFDPLAMKARELAEDLIEKTGEFAEEAIENVTEAAQQVKDYFDGSQKDE